MKKWISIVILLGTIGWHGSTYILANQHSSLSQTAGKLVFPFYNDCADESCDATFMIMNTDGSNPLRLIEDRFDPLYMTLAPDKAHFLFVSPVNGNRNIFVVSVPDRKVTQITFNKNTSVDFPNWSPDSKQLVFSAELVRGGNTTLRSGQMEIYTINADGSNQKRLTTNSKSDFHPLWSPDGQHIAFISDRDGHDQIYLMNIDGSDQKSLTYDAVDNNIISWSPDGNILLFTRYINGKSTVFTINIANDTLNKLTDNLFDDFAPTWSPDGQYIAFASNRSGTNEIYIMSADGTHQVKVCSLPNAAWPSWSLDGSLIAFTALADGGENEVYTTTLDGLNVKRITFEGVDRFIWASSMFLN